MFCTDILDTSMWKGTVLKMVDYRTPMCIIFKYVMSTQSTSQILIQCLRVVSISLSNINADYLNNY